MLYVEQFGKSAGSDKVELDLLRLEANWKYYIDRGAGDNALTKAIFSVFASRFCAMMLVTCFVTICSFATPFLVLYLIDFIRNGPTGHTWEEMKPGVYCALALCLAQGTSTVLTEHLNFWQVKTGARAQNMLVAMIYRKNARISDATNKEFD